MWIFEGRTTSPRPTVHSPGHRRRVAARPCAHARGVGALGSCDKAVGQSFDISTRARVMGSTDAGS